MIDEIYSLRQRIEFLQRRLQHLESQVCLNGPGNVELGDYSGVILAVPFPILHSSPTLCRHIAKTGITNAIIVNPKFREKAPGVSYANKLEIYVKKAL